MPLFGIDISSYQAGINLGEVRNEGFDVCFIKATQGGNYVNPSFRAQLAAAQSANLITAAYHYVTTDPVAAQIANITAHVPGGLPVIPDVETGSGDAAHARAIVDGLRAAGHPVPLLYLPQWYWQQIGRPDLSGLPPLWSSKYPSTNKAAASVLYQAVPQSYWAGYGNLPVAVLQFADSVQVAGQTVDASAFLGTRDQLAALIGGGGEPDMQLSDTYKDWAGNTQSVQGTFDHLDQKLTDLHNALLSLQPSRVPNSTVQLPVAPDAILDTNNFAFQILNALNAMAVQVAALSGALAKTEGDLLAAIKGVTTGSTDIPALAAAIEAALPADLVKTLGQKLAA